jgi:hypothetical protein
MNAESVCMRKEIFQLAVALFAITVLVLGRPVSMPDNVHTLHGLPLNWGTHQMVTIAGPVDTWRVNLVNLSIDLILWLTLVIVTPILVENIRK